MDDEEMELLREALERQAQRSIDAEIEELEAVVAATPTAQAVAMPGECHPFYADRRAFISDWLDGLTNYGQSIFIPLPVPITAMLIRADEPISDGDLWNRTIRLDRRRAWGLAPYVGRPFAYTWWWTEDDRGRRVAGAMAELQYTAPA